jgi:transcription elongation factor GreA
VRLKSPHSNPIIPAPKARLPLTICFAEAGHEARGGSVLKKGFLTMASAEKVPMLAEGHRQLTDELKRLRSEERPAIVEAIEEARAHGDLSENAEYHAAKERQGQIEASIAELEDRLSRAMIIDPATLSGNKVVFGATVTLLDEDEKKVKYQLVGQTEADARVGRISYNSPLGRALIGRQVGEEVEVSTPSGDRYYEIKKIEFL